MTVRGAAGFTLLLVLTAGSWYLSQSLRKGEIGVTATTSVRNGFYLRTARILGTGDDGRLLYEINAEFAEQVAGNLIELQNVSIEYSAGSGVPWKLVADNATISEERDYLLLEGDVIATSSAGFAGEVTEIRTQYLEFDPREYKVKTDLRVQVKIGSQSLTATGMLALLKDNQLTLVSNVNGKFVP